VQVIPDHNEILMVKIGSRLT